LVLLLAAWLAPVALPAGLEGVRRVYFWPMAHALDQYLAEQSVALAMFEVVVDPKLADAVMTERIDAAFLEALEEMHPTAEEQKAAAAKGEKTQGGSTGEILVERPKQRSIGRPRGTIFLVDVRSRQVLWSTFLQEFQPAPDQLHRKAQTVMERMKKATAPAASGS
jgi:hypothetical protein